MATHLAAALRVVASHSHRRRATISDARDSVILASKHVAAGDADPETLALVAKLEKVTGCPIDELARHATTWHDA